jgi:hypothetical protein
MDGEKGDIEKLTFIPKNISLSSKFEVVIETLKKLGY